MKAFVVPVLLIGLAVLTTTLVAAQCDAGHDQEDLDRWGSKQYILGDKCYAFMTLIQKNLYEANKSCSYHKLGVLAMPKTKAINDFLVSKLRDISRPLPFWIGLTVHGKAGSQNQYVWSDKSPLHTATDFHKLSAEELASSEGHEGNGVTLDLATGKWTVINPEQRRAAGDPTSNYYYICEYPHKEKK